MDRLGKKLLIAAVVAMATFGPAISLAGGAQGLGATQPAQADVSTNPQFHVYEWLRNGVAYVQVNDATGNVLMAVATGGGEVLVLPVGQPDAVQVVAPSINTAGAVVYADGAVLIRQVSTGYVVSASGLSPATTTSTAPLSAACGNPADCSQNP